MAKVRMVFTEEEIGRITPDKNGENMYYVDLHGLTCKAAQRFLKNMLFLVPSESKLSIIHGYHHGTALKTMIREQFTHPSLKCWLDTPSNEGMTCLLCY